MRVYELFLEATRSAKELIGYRGSLEWVKQNIPPDQYSQYGVTLTMIDKIGVNPQSRYNTPIGVYFYPLDFYVSETSAGRTMPFPEDPKYIKIFRINAEAGSYLDLDQLSRADFKELVGRIQDRLYEFVSGFPKNSGYPSLDRDEIDELIDDLVADSAADARVPTPAGRFWYVLWQSSSNIMNGPGLKKSRRNALIQAQRSSVLWNWMFRQLEISAVRDTQGIIHGNERTQGVVFDPKVIQLVRTFQVEDTRLLIPQQEQSMPDKLETVIKQYIDAIRNYRPTSNFDRSRLRLTRYMKYLFKTIPRDQLVLNDVDQAMDFLQTKTLHPTHEFYQPALDLAANTFEKDYRLHRAKFIESYDHVREEVDDILQQSDLGRAEISTLKVYLNRLGYNDSSLMNYINASINFPNSDLRNHSKIQNIQQDVDNLVRQGRSLEKAIADRLRATPGQEMII